jgi:ubiquinone/menaquinone biosynthesis C-methylase UbiE
MHTGIFFATVGMKSVFGFFKKRQMPPGGLPAGEATERAPQHVSERDHVQGGWRNEETGELFDGVVIGPDDVVVDVGCGDDPNIANFCVKRGARMILADVDPGKFRAILGQLPEAVAKSVETIVSDGGPLPLPDGIATRIVSTEVIEHVDDPDAFLAELARLGRSGALYILAVPDPSCEHLVKQVAPSLIFEKPHHVRILERDSFASLVERSGLVIERRSYVGFYQALRWLIYWADWVDPETQRSPVLDSWSQTWDRLLDAKDGQRIKMLLDQFLPKSQVIVARKP